MSNLNHELPTVAETLKHPAFPDAVWNLEPTRSGLLPVAEGRGGPFNISWEVHGEGPIYVVMIMGLGSLKSAWQRQTLHLGHENASRYSVLILDNRGMGDSDKPLMRYSTSEMARDTLEVLQHVGFLPDSRPGRCVHVIGLSLGGMIAQELACLIPDRISTLSLCCTAAAIENTTSFMENLASRASLVIPKGVEESARSTAHRIFSHAWLPLADDAHLPVPGTLRVQSPAHGGPYGVFDCNYQRFVAQEMNKRLDSDRFTTKGFLLQLIAAGWHRKTAAQLADMADRVGRQRIMVLHGSADGMISVHHGRKLIEYIDPGLPLIVDGMGHVPIMERTSWFNNLVEERFQVGEGLDGRPAATAE